MNLRPTNRQQLLGLMAALAVAILAGDYLVRAPLMASWNSRAQRLERLRKSVDDGEGLLRRQASVRETWDRMRTNTLSREVSSAESQVLRAFDAWARDSGVAVGGIRPQWKRSDNDLQTLECRADVTGSLPALSRFLHQAEIDPLGLRLETVELTVRDKTGDQLALALQVSALQIREPAR